MLAVGATDEAYSASRELEAISSGQGSVLLARCQPGPDERWRSPAARRAMH
jgi:hypothetical protein